MIRSRTFAVLACAMVLGGFACDSSDVPRLSDPEVIEPQPGPSRTPSATPTQTSIPTPTSPAVEPSATPTGTRGVATPTSPPPPTASPTAPVVVPTPVPAAARVEVRRAFAGEGDSVVVDIALGTAAAQVAGMQNDIVFDNTVIRLAAASSCRIAENIGDRLPECDEDPAEAPCKTLARSLVTCGASPQPAGCPPEAGGNLSRFRAIIAATAVPNSNAIPDGILYSCEFELVDRGRLPQAIRNLNLVVANPSGVILTEFVPLDGLVTVRAIVAAFAAAGAASLQVRPEDAGALPVRATIDVLGQIVGFTRTGATLALEAPLAADVPAGIEVFLVPVGVQPLPTPTPTASFGIPTATQTATPSTVAQGTATATATATATQVTTPAAAVVIEVGSAVAETSAVSIDIVLDSGGANVGGVQNDLLFDNTIVQLSGASACQINPAIGDRLPDCEEEPGTFTAPCKTLSRLLVTCGGEEPPDGCPPSGGSDISRFRAIIGATAVPNANPIPSGVLYTCTFQVLDPGALPAELEIGKVVASDPFGVRLEPALGNPGAIFPAAAP